MEPARGSRRAPAEAPKAAFPAKRPAAKAGRPAVGDGLARRACRRGEGGEARRAEVQRRERSTPQRDPRPELRRQDPALGEGRREGEGRGAERAHVTQSRVSPPMGDGGGRGLGASRAGPLRLLPGRHFVPRPAQAGGSAERGRRRGRPAGWQVSPRRHDRRARARPPFRCLGPKEARVASCNVELRSFPVSHKNRNAFPAPPPPPPPQNPPSVAGASTRLCRGLGKDSDYRSCCRVLVRGGFCIHFIQQPVCTTGTSGVARCLIIWASSVRGTLQRPLKEPSS
ncbi:eukaryotic translation initiation factor 3 subunit A-like [Sphaerodactylus townsendi]|uniref:eukaryotic translation initiation factor 3 subunit A-like n=1 Tax=Sphaerodactylus townsendi TaxID=933632 RepID=UPI002026CB28|nr:eukaryotic translation initiation factor 3 subunit A-like [Sphaerodactylus townsendi]